MTIGKNIGKVIPMKVSSMEPMMPRVTPELISLSGAIRERIGGLKEKLHPITAKAVSAVVADMNSYYSNLIEGHHTYPKDIERALQNDFSSNPQERNKQLLKKIYLLPEHCSKFMRLFMQICRNRCDSQKRKAAKNIKSFPENSEILKLPWALINPQPQRV